jgi:hypothetical protein
VWSKAGAAGAVGVVALMGCGSRTSMIDPDAYGTTGGTTSVSGSAGMPQGGGLVTGGAPVNVAGGTQMPIGGKNAVDPSLATVPCSKYCTGFAPLCPERLNGQECNSACAQEVNGFGKKCQGLGIKALNCLAPFFKAPANTCKLTVDQALVKCGSVVNKFQTCKDPDGVSEPDPTPDPPIVTPLNCPTMSSSGSDAQCFASHACPDGLYNVNCVRLDNGPTPSMSCSCLLPNGTSTYRVVPGTSIDACATMATLCY